MKIMTCFIDASAWVALIDPKQAQHQNAKDFFQYLLERDAKLVTNNYVIDRVLEILRDRFDIDFAAKFMKIIEESVLTINLRVDWISKRVRRSALNNFLRSNNRELSLYHFYLKESIKRKKVDMIFSFDKKVFDFGIPMMPQVR